MTRAALLLLTALAVSLGAAVWAELDDGSPTETFTAAAARRPAVAPTPPPPTPAPQDHIPEWVATSLARPLFAPDRRPAPLAAAGSAPTPTAAQASLPRLTGVIIGPAGKRAIFAAVAGGAKPRTVAEGDTIGQWTVRSIKLGEVEVEGPDGRQKLRPTFEHGPTPNRPLQPGQPQFPQPVVPPQIVPQQTDDSSADILRQVGAPLRLVPGRRQSL